VRPLCVGTAARKPKCKNRLAPWTRPKPCWFALQKAAWRTAADVFDFASISMSIEILRLGRAARTDQRRPFRCR